MTTDPQQRDVFPPRPGDSTTPHETPHPGPGGRLIRVVVVLGTIALVAVPIAVSQFPQEVARWYEARAIEQHLDGDIEAAHASIDTAIEWDDRNPDFYMHRAEWRKETKQYALGLAACDQAIELATPGGDDKIPVHTLQQLMQAYALRSEINHLMGNGKAAVADWQAIQQLIDQSEVPRAQIDNAQILNGLAYAHAVADFDADQGLAAAETAIEKLGGDSWVFNRSGLLLFKIGEIEAAARVFDGAVDLSYVQYLEVQQQLELAETAQDVLLGGLLDAGKLKKQRDELARHAAKSYFYRSIVRREAGREEQADQDLKRAKQLGANIKRLQTRVDNAFEFKTDDSAFATAISLPSAAAVLDTRGFLHYRLGNYPEALRDLNAALDLSETVFLHFPRQFEKQAAMQYEPREAERYMRRQRQTIAVLRYHRGLVYQEVGMTERAEQDFKRVEQLGFEPTPDLF